MKAAEPCDHYQVDLEGSFGTCKCGWPSADHKAKVKANAKEESDKQETEGQKQEEESKISSEEACSKFTPALDGATFDVCTCGFKKAAHGKKSEAPSLEVESSSGSPPPKKEVAAVPCSDFKLDMQGEFGHCVCGHSREAHKKAGTLKPPPSPLLMAGIEIDRRETVSGKMQHPGKREKPCAQYEEDVTASSFATCKCGHPKTQHKQFKKGNKFANDDGSDSETESPSEVKEEPKKVIDRSGKNGPCEEFLLDVDGKSGYGYCICGHPRADHHKEDATPDEYAEVKSKLTKPKEFT